MLRCVVAYGILQSLFRRSLMRRGVPEETGVVLPEQKEVQ